MQCEPRAPWWARERNPQSCCQRGRGLPHSPVCAMRTTFFRVCKNVRIGAQKFRLMVKGCPLLTMRRWELMSLVWCSTLFLAAWKSQLLIPRPIVKRKKSWRLGKYDNVSKCRDAGVRDQGLNLWLNSLTSCAISGK